MASSSTGMGWKVAGILLAIIVGIVTTWTGATSQEVKTIGNRQTATEENVRTIHYESQIQRALLKQIAEALDINTDGVADVRPLREAE